MRQFTKSSFLKEIYFVFFLLSLIFLFFLPFFYPELKTIVTPDFGQSDVLQLNLPLKFFLAESLKQDILPLWNPYIGAGFPALAEGQTGTFFIFNFFLFKFLPFELAFNFSLVLIFIINGLGTYLFSREIKLSPLISFLTALTFTFSGFFICHLTHFNLIQSASLFPLLLFLTLKITSSKNRFLWGGLFSFALSQQLFAGFPQITLISLIFALFLVIFPKPKLKILITFILLVLLGFLIASIQLFPQYEFFRISTRSSLENQSSTYYSYPFKHLITFINPYQLGDPRKGTYPPFWQFDGSIFWENTGYFGKIAVFIAFISLFLKIPQKRFFWGILILSFFLMTGKYSPLYFLYSFFPLSLFRVPSRFILPFVFALSILFGLSIKYLWQKRSLRIVLIILLSYHFIDLFSFSYNYHAIGKFREWLAKPATAFYLNNAPYYEKVLTLNTYALWNDFFTKKGWLDNQPFLYFRNDLNPNLNVLFKIPHFGVYPVQESKRYHYFSSFIKSQIEEKEKEVIINTIAQKLLLTAGVKYLTSYKNLYLEDKKLDPVFETKSEKYPSFKVYLLGETQPAFFTPNYKKVKTVEEVFDYWLKDINPQEIVLLEKEVDILPQKQNFPETVINLINQNSKEVIYEVENEQDGFLVIPQSFYPGWQVKVDNHKKEVLAANLNFQAVFLEKGRHQVQFYFQPISFKWGGLLTISGLFITFLIMFVSLLTSSDKVRKIPFL